MKNKIFLLLISIGLLITLSGIFILMLTNFESGTLLFSTGLSIVNLLGFILILKNSTLRKTIYFNIISILISITIIGAMFKIMHWPGSSVLLMVALLGIVIVYIVRFINKPKKETLDILKLAWVITTNLSSLSVSLHWLPKETTYIPNLIMLATTIYFAFMCFKNKELLES